MRNRLKDAREAGDKYYFTGKPCNKGHIDKRLASNGQCCTCSKKAATLWRENNPERYKEIVKTHQTSMRGKYTQHRKRAERCGIEFKISFEDWCKVWTESGKYEQRGSFKGGYVMSRKGDEGAYEVGNVFIQKHEDNARQGTNKHHENSSMRNVFYDKKTKSYRVEMIINGKKHWLGRHKDKEFAEFLAQEAREYYENL